MPFVVDDAELTFTDGVLASLAPWAPSGSDFANFSAALAAMFEDLYAIVSDQGSPDDPETFIAGWSVLLDVDRCPTAYLPYLGTYVGCFIPPGTDDATARATIRAHRNFQRGTPASVIAMAQLYLSGTQSVALLERTPTPYRFQIVVRPEEVIDEAQLIAAVNRVKPVGLVWQLIQTDAWVISQAEAQYSPLSALEGAFSSIATCEQDLP